MLLRLQIEHGTRFYGYREEVEECSHANIDIGSETGDMTSLAFTFKTREESGVLLYSGNDVSRFEQNIAYLSAYSS